MNIYIEVEVYGREFKARMLLAYYAAYKGFKVIIGSRNEILNLALNNSIPPGIIHLKDANSSDYMCKILKKLKDLKFKITAQDEESGLPYDDYNTFINRRFSDGNAFKYIDNFFCFGEWDHEALRKKYNKEIFKITGSPRFDMAKKNFYKEKKENFLKKFNLKKYIFFSSNIQYIINSNRSFIQQLKSRIDENENDEKLKMFKQENFFIKTRQNLEVLNEIIIILKKLANIYENFDIVIRPHPNEEIKTWKFLLQKNYKNIHIIKDDTLSKFINYSEILIHSGCTAAIESAINRTPVISFEHKIFEDAFDRDFCNSIGEKAKNFNDISKIIENLNNEKTNINQVNLEFRKRVYNYDNQISSSENMVNLWERLIEKENYKILKLNKFAFYLKDIKKIVKFLIRKKSKKNIKFPEILIKDLNNYHEEFVSFENKFSKIKYKILDSNLLYLFK